MSTLDCSLFFKNGYMNFDTLSFMTDGEFNMEDSDIMLNYEFDPFVNLSKFEQIICEIIPDKCQRKIFFTFLIDSLLNKKICKNLIFTNAYGIESFIELILNSLGDYIIQLNTSILANIKNTILNVRYDEIMKLKNKKICLLKYSTFIKPNINLINAINFQRNIILQDQSRFSSQCNLIVITDDLKIPGIVIDINDNKLSLLNSFDDKNNLFLNLIIKYKMFYK